MPTQSTGHLIAHLSRVGGRLSRVSGRLSRVGGRLSRVGGHLSRVGSQGRAGPADRAASQLYLRELLRLTHPRFYQHLASLGEDGLQLLFCHRWLLLCFKREFPEAEALRIWEACWAHYQVSGRGAGTGRAGRTTSRSHSPHPVPCLPGGQGAA